MATKTKTDVQATAGVAAGEYVRRVGQWYLTTSGMKAIDADNEHYSFRGYTPAGEEEEVSYHGDTIEVAVDGTPNVFTEEALLLAAGDCKNKAEDLLGKVNRLRSRAAFAPGKDAGDA